MDIILINIKQNDNCYGKYIVSKLFIRQRKPFQLKTENSIPKLSSKLKMRLQVNGIFLHYFIRELQISKIYRISFIRHFQNSVPKQINTLKFLLVPPQKEIIDYEWNYRLEHLVRERCELAHCLSWLSTLGGAFSALGDYYVNCAEIAGKISINQFKLALRLGDESIVARCKLFLSLSLIQQKRFKLAKRIIYEEYLKAKNAPVLDTRLVKMCKGIWSKLQYEYKVRKKLKKEMQLQIKV